MVNNQLRARGIHDEGVLRAMASIPRDAFVPDDMRLEAYVDEALPIGAGQTISQPYMVARMTELLGVEPGKRLLEIGTGSGYQAAILAFLGARVTSLERQESLIPLARARLEALGLGDRVEIRLADGSLGDPTGAPWDGIIVTAAAPSIPDGVRDQLVEAGQGIATDVGQRLGSVAARWRCRVRPVDRRRRVRGLGPPPTTRAQPGASEASGAGPAPNMAKYASRDHTHRA